jgi:glycine cleavage system aminomethyltransferase T
MKQDVERASGKVANLKCPRIERTVNDENDYGDENSEQISMVTSGTVSPSIFRNREDLT